MTIAQFLKVNSIALWSAIAAILNLGLLFHWWLMDAAQIAGINAVYIAVIMVLRQMFSVTDSLPPDA